MIALILETIDKFTQYKSPRHFAHYAGEDAADTYEDIASYLYLLLGNITQKCFISYIIIKLSVNDVTMLYIAN